MAGSDEDNRGRLAFGQLVAKVKKSREIQRWDQLQTEFLTAVSEFDGEYATGRRKSGWYQQKAGYFNDLLILLLQNTTGRMLGRSVKRKSALFDEIDIDLCYPPDPEKDPSVGAEAKILGAPPHPGNKNIARPAQQDIHKRVREVALTSVDFKARYARPQPINSFQSWIQETRPKYYSFWAFRIADDSDFQKIRQIMNALKTYCNGVGAFFYRGRSANEPTTYVSVPAPELSIDSVLNEMAFAIMQDLGPAE